MGHSRVISKWIVIETMCWAYIMIIWFCLIVDICNPSSCHVKEELQNTELIMVSTYIEFSRENFRIKIIFHNGQLKKYKQDFELMKTSLIDALNIYSV